MNYTRLYKILIFSLVFTSTNLVLAQSRQEKRKKESIEQLQKHIKYLASDELEGRQTGSPGEQLSASYIANEFKKNGLTLLGDDGFQKFTMTQFRIASDECVLRINSMPGAGESVQFELNTDFYPLSPTCDYDSCTAEVVDVGYGIVSEK